MFCQLLVIEAEDLAFEDHNGVPVWPTTSLLADAADHVLTRAWLKCLKV